MAATTVVRIEAAAEREDELVARLWALGCQGSWSEPAAAAGRIRLHAFFAQHELPAAAELARSLAGAGDLALSAAELVPERDWLSEWRAAARPIAVGRRFLVDPREPEAVETAVDAGERFLLRLPARTAFGVGSHESTRLAIELLEEIELTGKRVLDVGTGTGILAFAALRLGARAAVGCDVDPAAALLLPQFMALNGIRFPAFAGTVRALDLQKGHFGLEAKATTEREEAATSMEGKDRDKVKVKVKATTSIEGKDQDGTIASTGGENGDAGDRIGGGFEVALVNVVPSEIEGDLGRLVGFLESGGLAVFSGILSSQAGMAVALLGRHGFVEVRRREAGEWVAFLMELAA